MLQLEPFDVCFVSVFITVDISSINSLKWFSDDWKTAAAPILKKLASVSRESKDDSRVIKCIVGKMKLSGSGTQRINHGGFVQN